MVIEMIDAMLEPFVRHRRWANILALVGLALAGLGLATLMPGDAEPWEFTVGIVGAITLAAALRVKVLQVREDRKRIRLALRNLIVRLPYHERVRRSLSDYTAWLEQVWANEAFPVAEAAHEKTEALRGLGVITADINRIYGTFHEVLRE
jgi:hypothetical protein